MGPRKRSKPNPQSKSDRSLESPDSKPSTESQTETLPSTHSLTRAGDLKHSREDSSVDRQETTVCMNLTASLFRHAGFLTCSSRPRA